MRPSATELKCADISVMVVVPRIRDQLEVIRLQLLERLEVRIEVLVQVRDLFVLVLESCEAKTVYDKTSPSARACIGRQRASDMRRRCRNVNELGKGGLVTDSTASAYIAG